MNRSLIVLASLATLTILAACGGEESPVGNDQEELGCPTCTQPPTEQEIEFSRWMNANVTFLEQKGARIVHSKASDRGLESDVLCLESARAYPGNVEAQDNLHTRLLGENDSSEVQTVLVCAASLRDELLVFLLGYDHKGKLVAVK